MKRLPCLICSVNIAFINNERGMSLNYSTSAILCLKYFSFSAMVYYWDLPVTNLVVVFLQIMFIMLLVTGLVWQFFFFLKIRMCAFTVIGSSTKCCHGSTIVLLSVNPTFYQIYHHLRITPNFFFIWSTSFECLLSKVLVFFIFIIDKEVFFHHMVHICLTEQYLGGQLSLNVNLNSYWFWNQLLVLQEILFYYLHHKQELQVILSAEVSDI